MELSIVSTMYKSEKYIEKFLISYIETVSNLNIKEFEIILVNDGSPDCSLDTTLRFKKSNPHINLKIVDLSKNFGHHNALMAGLSLAEGNYVYIADIDLEVDPKNLITFYNEIKKEGYDVVYGVSIERQGNFIRKNFGNIFWKLFNLLSETKVPENITNERIMNKKYVKSLLTISEKNFFIGGIWYWIGFNQKKIYVEKTKNDNFTSYNVVKRIKLAFEAITSFSHFPLYLVSLFGVIISFISFLFILFMLIRKIIHPDSIILGYTSIIISIFFSTGLILVGIGVLGIYLGKTFKEVKNRPLFIINQIY